MRILVIGAGATGGFYGGRLALAGRDVTFLVHDRRREQLERTGLILRTPGGEESLKPKLIGRDELPVAEPFDLILLAVKAYSLEAAIEDFAVAVGPETMILPLLNGMRQLDVLDARFAPHNVLGGLCRVVGDMDSEGRILQMTKLSEIAYGERNRELTARIERVDQTMQGVGFTAILSPDILQLMWGKWMLLAALGTINTLSRGSIGAVEAVKELEGLGRQFAMSVQHETIAVAAAEGFPPDASWVAAMQARLNEAGSTLESSMYRGLSRGFPVEADQIIGDLVQRARKHAVATPLLEACYVQLRVFENARIAAKRD